VKELRKSLFWHPVGESRSTERSMIPFRVQTRQRTEFLDITQQVADIVRESDVKSGCCVVFVPHTTAGITIQENADPDVVRDMRLWFDQHVPKDLPGFRHAEGNSDSHIKTALVGNSSLILFENGSPLFGTWQGIYLCEFDGPRTRTVFVQMLSK
jgi:secondary thiamine-phosphate synthase enzyme